mmetsp:Transcript_11426/g.28876  ORF Transcript_11426/g.28876 Transcript_11426/m.28876 type:complete len:294 (-) Transcript_11426:246-1127(-)
MGLDGIGNGKLFFGVRQPICLLGGNQFFFSERRSVATGGSSLAGTSLSDDCLDANDGGLSSFGLGGSDGISDIVQFVDVVDFLDMPVVGFVSLCNVLRETEGGVTVDGDVVVVVQKDQFSKSHVSCQARGLARDTLLKATIAADDVGVVVENFVFVSVVGSGEMSFRHGQSDGVGDSLSERASRNFHSFGDKIFRVSWSSRTELTEILKVLQFGGFVSRQVEHCVLKGAGMSVGKDKAITVDPVGVGRRVVHDLAPQNMGHRSASHGGAGVTRVGRLDHVGRNGTDGVDTFFF